MGNTLPGRVALYTTRPEEYANVNADIVISGPLFTPEALIDGKSRFLSGTILVVDFAGFSDFSPMSFLTGALKGLVEGSVRAVAGIGAGQVPIEQMTNESAEKEVVAIARKAGRLGFLESAGDLGDWLGELNTQS